MADDDYCYLTTTGRVTGSPHEIEIWYVREGSTLYLLAGAGRRSDWVRNLEVEPAVTVRFGADPQTFGGRGRILDDGSDAEERARSLVFEKYQPRNAGDLGGWRVDALPVAVDLAVNPG